MSGMRPSEVLEHPPLVFVEFISAFVLVTASVKREVPRDR